FVLAPEAGVDHTQKAQSAGEVGLFLNGLFHLAARSCKGSFRFSWVTLPERDDALPVGVGKVDAIVSHHAVARIVRQEASSSCGGPFAKGIVGVVYALRNTRIFGDQCGQHGLKGLDVGSPIECNLGPKNAGEWIPRHDCQRAVQGSSLVCVATQVMIGRCQLLKSEKVARIQFNGTLLVARGLFPMTLAAFDVAGVSEYVGVVGRRAPGDS